jgi:putative spermidine/putrescine transport system substrate-binding protein
MSFNRRHVLQAALGAPLLSLLPNAPAHAAGSLTAAIYPGAWEDAYRAVVVPALKANSGTDVGFEALFAVDEIAKARAARGNPSFDVFLLDPGPRASGIEYGLYEPFDPSRLKNASKLPSSLIDNQGIAVAAQVVGIAYNPKKVAKPAGWKDLFKPEFAKHLGLTGFQTTFGTMCIIEIAKAFGGSETDVEPAFTAIRKILPDVAAVSTPAALPGLFQQGQVDLMYINTQTVTALQARGVDIEFVVPDTGGSAFVTTMHIAKGARNVPQAYEYLDTVLSTPVQDALAKSPYSFTPVNKEVDPGPGVPMKSVADLDKFNTYDWAKINLQRAKWIDRFNKEMTK